MRNARRRTRYGIPVAACALLAVACPLPHSTTHAHGVTARAAAHTGPGNGTFRAGARAGLRAFGDSAGRLTVPLRARLDDGAAAGTASAPAGQALRGHRHGWQAIPERDGSETAAPRSALAPTPGVALPVGDEAYGHGLRRPDGGHRGHEHGGPAAGGGPGHRAWALVLPYAVGHHPTGTSADGHRATVPPEDRTRRAARSEAEAARSGAGDGRADDPRKRHTSPRSDTERRAAPNADAGRQPDGERRSGGPQQHDRGTTARTNGPDAAGEQDRPSRWTPAPEAPGGALADGNLGRAPERVLGDEQSAAGTGEPGPLLPVLPLGAGFTSLGLGVGFLALRLRRG